MITGDNSGISKSTALEVALRCATVLWFVKMLKGLLKMISFVFQSNRD